MTNDSTCAIIILVNKEKRLAAIRNNPNGVRFSDLLSAAISVGFVLVRQRGSHVILRHPTGAKLNIQNNQGRAKPYQVKDFLAQIERFRLE